MTRSLESELDPTASEFERRLFDSARTDGPRPGDEQKAWSRFAAEAGALTGGVAGVGSVVAVDTAPAVDAFVPRSWWRAPQLQALKWVLIGALGGGALVAVWLHPALHAVLGSAVLENAEAPQPPPASVQLAAAGAQALHAAGAPPLRAAAPELAAAAAPAPASAAQSVPLPARPRPPQHAARLVPPAPAARPSDAHPSDGAQPASASLLAQEVAALDAARATLAAGATASALQQIQQYHRDFPAGELSADADVVAIEALSAAGDRAAVEDAARRFLARYPRDPHAARIRELASESVTRVE